MSSVKDVSEIPTAGERLVIVAAKGHVLCFRIFDDDGKMVEDTDSTRRTAQAPQIDDLRKQLENRWPPHRLNAREKGGVIDAVSSILGHTPREDLGRQLCYFGDGGSYEAYRELARAAWRALYIVKDELLESPAGRRLREVLAGILDAKVVPAHLGRYAPGYWTLAVFGLLEVEDRGTGTLLRRWGSIPADRLDAWYTARRRALIEGQSPHPVVPMPADEAGTEWDFPDTADEAGTEWIVPIPRDEAGTERELLLRYGTIRFVTVNDMFASSEIAIGALARLLDDEPATPRPGASAAGRGTGGTDPAPAPGYLGLVLDDDENRRVTRSGREGEVAFKGKIRAWALFRELWKNGERYIDSTLIYERVWGHKSGSATPDKITIRRTITDIRKLIEPLGVGVENNRESGYRLVPLAPEAPSRARLNKTRTKPSH
jgi:hypothetical protein